MSEEQENRKHEIEEIKRRIEYLVSTDKISISEKIAIAKRALEIIEKDKVEKGIQWTQNNKP